MGIMEFIGKLFGKGKNGNGSGSRSGSAGGTQTADGVELMCVECRKPFLFETGEQKFYKMRGLTSPKRCTSCRRQKKRHRRR